MVRLKAREPFTEELTETTKEVLRHPLFVTIVGVLLGACALGALANAIALKFV